MMEFISRLEERLRINEICSLCGESKDQILHFSARLGELLQKDWCGNHISCRRVAEAAINVTMPGNVIFSYKLQLEAQRAFLQPCRGSPFPNARISDAIRHGKSCAEKCRVPPAKVRQLQKIRLQIRIFEACFLNFAFQISDNRPPVPHGI